MKIINFDTLPSTNLYLKQNYNLLDEYTIIKANNQTNGKGRMDRKWMVEANSNLTFSILLKPKIDINIIPLISLVTGAACYLTLNKYIKVSIKWPNDIMINNKKVVGILLESIYSNKLEALIVGVGINVNQTMFNDEIKHKATSLKCELNKDMDINKLLDEFLINFDYLYQDYLNGNNKYISICKENNYLKNKIVKYNNKEVKVLDILDNGDLEVEMDNKKSNLHFGEVTLENTYH